MSVTIRAGGGTAHPFGRPAAIIGGIITAASLIGLGTGMACAPAAVADDSVRAPVLPGAGDPADSAFLHLLSSTLDRTTPGADAMVPAPPPGAAGHPTR